MPRKNTSTLYEPAEEGAVAEQVYDPRVWVVTVTMFVLQLNTHTIVSAPTPTPFAVSVPETVNGEPGDGVDVEGDAVSMVETGLVSEPVWRFRVIVPDPLNVTRVGSFEPEHTSPPEQLQLESV